MRSKSKPLLSFAIVVAVGASVAARPSYACGPSFLPTLLDDREATLLTLPDGPFLIEARRIVAVPTGATFAPTSADPDRAPSSYPVDEGPAGLAYARGARRFHAGDHEGAAHDFRAVLALSPNVGRQRAAAAAYSLARITQTPAAFRRVRDVVAAGAVDVFGLAIASYGEEARLALARGDDVEAVRLYALQAALGDDGGALSLLFVARSIVRDPARLRTALRDPVSQRLVAAYLATRANELVVRDWENDTVDPSGLRAVLDVVSGVERFAGADLLAAALYRSGRSEQAKAVVARAEPSALSSWVKAKLALRAGERGAAARHLDDAAALLDPREVWPGEIADVSPRARVIGERAALALADGDVPGAAARLLTLRAHYWADLAVVAERVLTTDELAALVADAPPEPQPPPRSRGATDDAADCVWGSQGSLAELQGVLGRRLVREGRVRDGIAALAAAGVDAATLDAAHSYARALDAAAATAGVDRAEHLFTAAVLARRHGMEMMGTEVGPDWHVYHGQYDPLAYDDRGDPGDGVVDRQRRRLDATDNAAYTTELERARSAAHAPSPPARFHYRHTAAELAARASELVPERSQAFAALLCHAHRWSPLSQARARYYATYIGKGAVVDFGFGGECPAPAFQRARDFVMPENAAVRRDHERRLKRGAVIAVVGTVGVIAIVLGSQRRRRAIARVP